MTLLKIRFEEGFCYAQETREKPYLARKVGLPGKWLYVMKIIELMVHEK